MPNNDCPKCEELAQKYAARADRIRATPILPIFSSPDPSNHTNVKDIQPIKPNQNNQKNPQTTQTQKKTTHQEGRTNIGRVMGILGRVLKWVGSKSLGIVNLMFSPSNLNEGEEEFLRQYHKKYAPKNTLEHLLSNPEDYTDDELAEALKRINNGTGSQNDELLRAEIERRKILNSALSKYNDYITHAGRAVTKHPKYFGFNSHDELKAIYRLDSQLNELGEKAIRDILKNGTRTEGSGGRYPNGWITYTLPDGRAASWHKNGEFIGFRGIE